MDKIEGRRSNEAGNPEVPYRWAELEVHPAGPAQPPPAPLRPADVRLMPRFRSLRIAMVGVRGVPACYGGIERAVEELGKCLVRSGHEVSVFCMAGRYAEQPASYEGMRLHYLPTLRGKHREMLFHAALGNFLAGLGAFDVVHVHACGPSLLAWLPRLAGKAVVCTLHGQDWRAPKWGRLARAALKTGEWVACRLATRTTVVSQIHRRFLAERYATDSICIPNGVSRVTPTPLGRAGESFGLEAGEYLAFVGRLTPGKNVHHLLQAFRSVETTKKLVIVGGDASGGGYMDRVRSMAAWDKRVILTGTLLGQPLAEIFSNAYLFVFPTEHEGMPVALLEALAYGVPTLASDIPENLEVIANEGASCGLTFQAGSVAHLAERLRHALANPDKLTLLREHGRSLVARRYTWESAAKRMLEVYLEAIEERSRHRSRPDLVDPSAA
jgi:glycosyltransferase involved in cell wall biosynthesis